MRSDNLKTHMKIHENIQKRRVEKTDKLEYDSTLDIDDIESLIVGTSNEYQRKLELGRVVKDIIVRQKIIKASLSAEHAEALKLFEKHGQVKEINPIDWRPWQFQLLKYIDHQTHRRIIWVVGKKGKKGKSFF